MGSLQAALPDALLPAAFGGIAEPWLPQNTVTPYISSAGEGNRKHLNHLMRTHTSQWLTQIDIACDFPTRILLLFLLNNVGGLSFMAVQTPSSHLQ